MKNRILSISFLLFAVVTLLTATASAEIAWSVESVDKFSVPDGNLVPSGSFSNEMSPRLRFVYDWEGSYSLDKSNFLTGTGALLIEKSEPVRGRYYIDIPVDSSTRYKLGFVIKTEGLTLADDKAALRWGVFFKDAFGSWINFTDAAKQLPADYFNGLVPSGIVLRTPETIDLGHGPAVISGDNDWFNIEITLDLKTLAQDLQASLGQITTVRIEQILYGGSGKIWVDSLYLSPLQ